MKLTIEAKKQLEQIYQTFLNNEKVQRMKSITMHRGSNCFIHSFRVAKLAIKRALRHKKGNLEHILIGAILHDYYLYDWRVEKEKKTKHPSKHPGIAMENAKNDFAIDKEIQSIIKSHMWPFNFKAFPSSKEARIVSLADKTIAFKEAMTSKKYKAKREQKYLDDIHQLFNLKAT